MEAAKVEWINIKNRDKVSNAFYFKDGYILTLSSGTKCRIS